MAQESHPLELSASGAAGAFVQLFSDILLNGAKDFSVPLPVRVQVSALAFLTAAIDAGSKIATCPAICACLSDSTPPVALAAEVAELASSLDHSAAAAGGRAALDNRPGYVWTGLRQTFNAYITLLGPPSSPLEQSWIRLCISDALLLSVEDLAEWGADSEDCEAEWEGAARLSTVRGAAEALLLAIVSDATRAVPVCSQLLAHSSASCAAAVEAAATAAGAVDLSASLLSCDAALSALGLAAADAVARDVLTAPSLASWWLGDATRLFWACGVTEPAQSASVRDVDSVLPRAASPGTLRTPLKAGCFFQGASEQQQCAAWLLLRRLLWTYGCCMGAATAELNLFTLRLCLTTATGVRMRKGPAGVALAALATSTSIVQTLPLRRSGAGVAPELPPQLVLDVTETVSASVALCVEPTSQQSCLALLGATLARCGAETVLRVAGTVLQRLGALLSAASSAGSGADPAFTRASLALVRAVVQSGHDAIRATTTVAAHAASASHAPAMAALLAAGGSGDAHLRLHEAADGPEARARLAAAGASDAVAALCVQLQPLWSGVLPFVAAACSASAAGGAGCDGDPMALGFLVMEALRILWMIVLGCADIGSVRPAVGLTPSLSDCFLLLPPIIHRGGEPLGSAVAVAWAFSLRLSGEVGAPAFCAEPRAGGALAAMCDAALSVASPSQVSRAVALLEAALAIASAVEGAGSPLLAKLQVRWSVRERRGHVLGCS